MMMVNDIFYLKPLCREQMSKIIEERNKVLETLRTPLMLNEDMQYQYFDTVICNRNSTTRYFALYVKDEFVGYGGIENIQFENRIGEISILIFSEFRKKGYGEKFVDKILQYAFNYLNLENVWGECYLCGNVSFWQRIIEKHKAFHTKIPNRKYYNGLYFSSLYFNFNKGY